MGSFFTVVASSVMTIIFSFIMIVAPQERMVFVEMKIANPIVTANTIVIVI